MSKCYVDIGTNSMGGWNKLVPILGITDDWQKIFIEPNPEHWDGVRYFIDKTIDNIPNAILIKKALALDNEMYELLTRSDMQGDSAATILGEKFITESIGSVNQANPEYISFMVQGITMEDILNMTYADEIFIKIDAEGIEFDVLENFPIEYIPRIKRMFVEFHAHDDLMRQRKYNIINEFKIFGLTIENWD